MKKIKLLLSALIITGVMGANIVNSYAAISWSSWKTSSSYDYTCDTSDGCGFLWLKDRRDDFLRDFCIIMLDTTI